MTQWIKFLSPLPVPRKPEVNCKVKTVSPSLRRAFLFVAFMTPLINVFAQSGPPITNMNGTVCVGDNAGFRVTPGSCVITSWYASTGGTFQGSNTGQVVYVKWTSAQTNAWVQVNYSNCTYSFLDFKVNAKTTPAVTFSITSNASTICSTGNVTFQGNMTNGCGSQNYNWYIDNVLRGTTSATAGTGTTSSSTFSYATSNLTAGSHSAYVVLTALQCANVSSVTSTSTSFTVPASVAITSGPTGTVTRCAGTGSDTYTVSATNATSYAWSISPSGAGTISSGGVVTWNGSFTGAATVSVIASGCYGSPTATASLSVNTIAFAPAITNGPTSRCQGSGSDTYAVTVGSSCSITGTVWTLTPASAGTIVSGASGYVTWSSSFYGTATVWSYCQQIQWIIGDGLSGCYRLPSRGNSGNDLWSVNGLSRTNGCDL